jgi:hypothetical protein
MFRIVLVLALALALSGCAAVQDVKSKTSAAIADIWPTFLGGLPADAPPRPSDPRYAKFVQQEKQQLAKPKAKRPDESKPAAAGQKDDAGRKPAE